MIDRLYLKGKRFLGFGVIGRHVFGISQAILNY